MNKVEIYLIGLLAVFFTFSCTDLANNSDDELKSLEDLESSVRLNIHFTFSFDNNTYVADGISVKIGNNFYTTRELGEIITDTLLLRNDTYEINVDSEYFEPFVAQIEISSDTSISQLFELVPEYKKLFPMQLSNSWIYKYSEYNFGSFIRGKHHLEIIDLREHHNNNVYTFKVSKFDTSYTFNSETNEREDTDTTHIEYTIEVLESNSNLTVDPNNLINDLEYPFMYLKDELKMIYPGNSSNNKTLKLREDYPSIFIQEDNIIFQVSVPVSYGLKDVDFNIEENIGIKEFGYFTSTAMADGVDISYELLEYQIQN